VEVAMMPTVNPSATFSVAILHKCSLVTGKYGPRCDALEYMHHRLGKAGALRIFDDPCPGDVPWNIWQHDLHPRVWQWAIDTNASHHIFMTDDLHLAPHFWPALEAMVCAKPDAILGLLSNHPAGPRLAESGARWYRCNSWVVGPAYVVPHAHLVKFLAWYKAWIPTVNRGNFGDDSSLNEWISREGPGESWHPLPTIIEHRDDIESTWQGGDQFSKERVSWRFMHEPVANEGGGYKWDALPFAPGFDMTDPKAWDTTGPMLRVGGCSASEAEGWKP
jgi:hypothetical protein